MISQLEYTTLQEIWWILVSVVGAIFLFLTFVQGGQSLLWQIGKNETEKSLIINSLGRKWELTYTTLVLFGGALFAAFPKFYATSFGGAYWVWMLILLTFIIQAISYEYRKKPNNFLGQSTYEIFLMINGFISILLIGIAVGTFFTGSNYTLDMYSRVTWQHPLRGLEAVFSIFNICFGLFLMFNARVLGSMYLLNNVDFTDNLQLKARLIKSVGVNFIVELLCLIYVLSVLLLMRGFHVTETGEIIRIAGKYGHNLLQMPAAGSLLLLGLILVVWGVYITIFKQSEKGIWPSGLGTVLMGLSVFFLCGFNNTPFYPSKTDLVSSLTIYNASSSHFTLTTMAYVALGIPFVLAYIVYVWKLMNSGKITAHEALDEEAY